MTPEQKCKELINSFMPYVSRSGKLSFDAEETAKSNAKRCALIAVNLLIKDATETAMVYDFSFDEKSSYWTKVKNEILKL